MGGFGGVLKNFGRAIGKREKKRVQKKYGFGAAGNSNSGSGGIASDVVRDATRRKRAGKSRE